MKRWAFLTVLLYFLAISFLVTPILAAVGGSDREIFIQGFFVFFVPALLLIQGILLLVPAQAIEGRPVKRRTVGVSAVAGGIPMAILLTAMVWFMAFMVLGEDGAMSDAWGWVILGLVGSLWVGWSVAFYRAFSSEKPGSLTTAITRWLLVGSILEVLVAIPAHILSRHRGECCAPGYTLMGLVTGISVAVMAFGPAFFLLLVGRVREKTKASAKG